MGFGLGILPASIAFSQAPSGMSLETSVQWYEPKVEATKRPDVNRVTLIGKTEPDILVQLSSENIVVIQRQGVISAFQPKVGQQQVRSNSKGYFRISLFVPSGLLQVPIEFLKQGTTSPILLTMRVDSKDVSLNVKVIRPKTKIVKVAPAARYSLRGGWAPFHLRQSAELENLNQIQNSESAVLGLRLDGSMKYEKWWWLAHYQYSNVRDMSLQAMSLGSRYKISSSELWLDAEIDGRSLPLLTRSSSDEVSSVNTQVFRAGVGLTYLRSLQTMSISGGLSYRVPVAVKVEAGEIVVTSPFTVKMGGRVILPYEKSWSFVFGLDAEYSSFKYEHRNTPASIDNQGKYQSTLVEVLALIQYDFQ